MFSRKIRLVAIPSDFHTSGFYNVWLQNKYLNRFCIVVLALLVGVNLGMRKSGVFKRETQSDFQPIHMEALLQKKVNKGIFATNSDFLIPISI